MSDNGAAMAIITAAWGEQAPEWIVTLAKFCDANTQSEAARRLKRSASLVNAVLKKRYTGDMEDVQKRVEQVFAKKGPVCPVLGQITGEACMRHQQTPYNPSNHIAVRLYSACSRCPHNVSKNGGRNVK